MTSQAGNHLIPGLHSKVSGNSHDHQIDCTARQVPPVHPTERLIPTPTRKAQGLTKLGFIQRKSKPKTPQQRELPFSPSGSKP